MKEQQAQTGLASMKALFDRCCRNPSPQWLTDLRQKAMSAFVDAGFPTRRNEEWKYTSLVDLAERRFRLPDAVTEEEIKRIKDSLPQSLGTYRAVLVNGRLEEGLSTLPERGSGLLVKSLHRAIHEDAALLADKLGRTDDVDTKPMSALNSALWQDGLLIYVHSSESFPEPLEVLHLTSHAVSEELPWVSPRLLLLAGENSRLVLLERFLDAKPDESFTNAVMELELAQGARVDHLQWQTQAQSSRRIQSVQSRVARDARYDHHLLSLGASLFRSDVDARLVGPGAEANLYGLHYSKETQHVDLHTSLDHQAAHTTSREVIKGVLDDRSVSVFNGKVIVQKDAQKTSSEQQNRNLLLSNKATVNTKPQLEIFADDVKCAHGATTGSLDEKARFYLRSRGIPSDEADALLLQAFAGDVINKLPGTALTEEALRLWNEARSPRAS